MKNLSPVVAAELAEMAYDIKKPTTVNGRTLHRVRVLPSVKPHFTFDASNSTLSGRAGNVLLRKKEYGFVLAGYGNSAQNKNDLVLAFRGTAGLSDIITDASAGFSVADGGSTVHAGFNHSFNSLKKGLISLVSNIPSNGTIHCVGHSLGGALASLAADWIRRNFHRNVKLYTFGAPRVGLDTFARSTTNLLEEKNIFRCVNGGDPVPMIPVWPFIHAPHNGVEYLSCTKHEYIKPSQHKMANYQNNVKTRDWHKLDRSFVEAYNRKVYLKPESFSMVRTTQYWAHRISQALVTLLMDAGIPGMKVIACALQTGFGNTLNLFDRIAVVLHKEYVLEQPHVQANLQGLLAHMLAFCGYAVRKVTEMGVDFIRWVFQKTMDRMNRMAMDALMNNEK